MLGTLAQHGDRLIILRELGPGAVEPSHRQQLRGCDLAGPLPGFPLHLRSLARDEFTHLFEIFLQSSLEVLLFCHGESTPTRHGGNPLSEWARPTLNQLPC